ncbi:MAG: ImmA/IrrE family metallo-endopeptidase [Oscillospiraceae bacterium]|nr:ImmA/IrrE family metallo-endopeptidase [Oscillospiraceae bacterium]
MQLSYPQKGNGLYVLNRDQIDQIATMILEEYMPNVLACPQSVDIEDFVENKLFLTLQYQTLGFGVAVLGLTAFEDVQGIPCLDEMYRPAMIDISAGTILIHSELRGPAHRARRKFTIAHEGAHWILHRSFYSPTNQRYVFRVNQPYIVCRATEIEQKSHRRKTDEDWAEWQADTLAAALLMPQAPFHILADSLIRKGRRRALIDPTDPEAIEIIEEIAETFEVSRMATEIRLTQFGYLQKEQRRPVSASSCSTITR